jgi:hypothetical protein
VEQRTHDKDQAQSERTPQSGELEPPEPDPVERLASTVGNYAFGTLARQGSGILPDGRVHPDVETAIGRAKGGGQSLDSRVGSSVGEHLGDDYGDVNVHTGGEADQLARAVSAKAFTTGTDLFFASGQYQPGTSSGDELIAHELTHVSQQRGAPQSGPLTVTQPGDAMEREADKVAGELA